MILQTKRPVAVSVLALILFGLVVGPVRAEINAEQVRRAIDRGIHYLKDQQNPDGSWFDQPAQHGGVSALCTLALLTAGVDVSDPAMQRALEYLRRLEPERTYVVSLQTMVFARATPVKDALLIKKNVEWLEETQLTEGEYKGSWTYPGFGGRGDNSNSQFALLALYEAERVGIHAKKETWRRSQAYWESCQGTDGSWSYIKGVPMGGTGSMTCAGITSLVIASDTVQPPNARVDGDRIRCCVPHDAKDENRIKRGLTWLGRHYSVHTNPNTGGGNWLLYYLYGLERAGRLTGQRFLTLPTRQGQPNRADWYREGADFLVHQQDRMTGFWTGGGRLEHDPVIGTSFALLFLSKGRWPVLMGKVQYGLGEDWNRHHGDVANLTRYVESRWKRDLTWQVIDLRLATVEDLAQTPVLYFCGSQNPLPENPAERTQLAQKIRDYLDRGGFLFAEGYCGGSGFDEGFRELMQLVFPEPEYKLRLLEPEHPVWYAEERVDPQHLRPVYGVEFGCRTSVVYVPLDPPTGPRPSLSCLWELSRPGRDEKYHPAVQAQIDAAMKLGINVLAYATNRELADKLEPSTIASSRPADRLERGRLDVATLRHPGGCNVAPRALTNLMDSAARELKNTARFRPHVRDELLGITDDSLPDYHMVFMHGRTSFHLTDAERQRLRQYVERGGAVFADSICASKAFTESFRREMATIFPDHKLERIPVSDPLWSKTYGGFDLKLVSRRDPEAMPPGGGRLEDTIRRVPPDLEGIKLGDHWSVIFSQYDLSCALEKHNSLECRGYTREDAARIGLNVVLYSLLQ